MKKVFCVFVSFAVILMACDGKEGESGLVGSEPTSPTDGSAVVIDFSESGATQVGHQEGGMYSVLLLTA